MKKFLMILLSVIVALSALCGCGSTSTSDGSAERNEIIGAEDIERELKWFLGVDDLNAAGNTGNRTYTSESEYNSAVKIYERFKDSECLEATHPDNTKFDVKITTPASLSGPATQITRSSQNVEVRFGGKREKQIIIGAGYGNKYGNYEDKSSTASTGVYDNATGVATVLALMQHFEDNAAELNAKLDFGVAFVFFGCSDYNNSLGATNYVDKMTPNERLNTAAMFNITKLGGERAYLYANDYRTEREDFLRDKATAGGYEFYDLPDNMPIIEAEYIDGVNYTHYAMIGDHAVFTEWGINSVCFTGGYYGGFNLSDLEHSGEKNVAGTSADTYENLMKVRSGYAKQGSDVASLIVSAIKAEGFIEAMSARDADYSFWLEPLWAQLILLGVIVLLGVLTVVLVKVFEKKYPYVPKTKKMKIAVFGPEYEDKKDDEIIIDVNPNNKNNNPFDI